MSAAPRIWPVVRLPWLAVALAAGVCLGQECGPPRLWWLAAALLALIAPWRRPATWIGVAALIGAALGAADAARVTTLPEGPVADDRSEDEVTGVVDGPVAVTRWGSAVRIAVDGGDARVWLMLDGVTEALPGDRVRAAGRLRTPRGYRNPGSADRRALAASRGVDLELRAGDAVILERDAVWTPWRTASRWQRGASAWIAARGGDAVGSAVVRGAVLGDRSAIAPAVDDAWRAAGVYHVLSVSGLHLAVVALLSFAALRRILAVFGGRLDPTRAAAIAAAGLAVAYTMVTGAEVATVRALLVALAVLGGAALARRPRAIDALGLAALVIVAHTPAALRDPSFQLSFSATAALLATRRPTVVVLETRRWKRAVLAARRWLVRGLGASLWISLVTAPITALHFQQVAVGGVIGNLIVTPVVELVVIPAALLGLVLSHLSDAAGGAVVDIAILVCGAMHDVVAWLAGWTPVIEVPPPTATQILLAAILAVAWVLRHRVQRRASLAVAAATAIALAVSVARPRDTSVLRVTFLDVGQGDAAIIEVPGGEVWLVDAGGLPYVPPGDDALAVASAPGEVVARFLAVRRIERIDVAVVSHPHPDHYLGLVALAQRVPIGELWSAEPASDGPAPAAPGRVPTFTAVAARLDARGTRLVHPPLGEARRRGDTILRVLAPVHDPGDGPRPHAAADPVRSVNDDSLVVTVERAGRRILFAGDIEAEGEDRLVSLSSAVLPADVVKVPHHGSPTSSGEDFVAATHPGVAVISLGAANRFGFPADDVVARWTGAGARVLRTDQRGAITVEIDAGGDVSLATHD